MKNKLKKPVWPSVLNSLSLLFLGLLLFFKSSFTLVAISYVIGSLLISVGVIALIRFTRKSSKDIYQYLDIIYGIISIIAGIFLIVTPKMLSSIIPFIVGIIIIINSSIKISESLLLKSYSNKYWITSMLISIVCLICGVLLLFYPFQSASTLIQLIGVYITIYAILDLLNTVILKTKINRNIEELYSINSDNKETKDAKIVKEKERE